MGYSFKDDWTTGHADNWTNLLKHFIGQPKINMLEIGAYEGRSTVWFLENILTDITSSIVCIDPHVQANFHHNISEFKNKLQLIEKKSQIALRDPYFADERFDIIYVDGNHDSCDVLEDAVLSFRSLKKGGIMIFDDYEWKKEMYIGDIGAPLTEPKLGIDCFMKVFDNKYKLLHKAWQVIILKT